MRTALLIPLLALAGCVTAQAPPTTYEGPAKLGQATYVDGPVVIPLEVIEDSRCPANARCVWAGRVVLRARIAGRAWETTRDLTLGERVQIADGSLALASVTPDRWTDRTIEPEDYRFGFEFQGGL